MACSTEKLPCFWRGGNCWKLTRCCATSDCSSGSDQGADVSLNEGSASIKKYGRAKVSRYGTSATKSP